MLRELVQSLGTGSIHNGCEILVAAGFLPKEFGATDNSSCDKQNWHFYGATELATPALLSRSCAEGDLYWLAPAPNRTVRIVDENGDDCPPGQQGELRIRLMDIDCTSYIDDEETTTKVFCDRFSAQETWPSAAQMGVFEYSGVLRTF